MNCMTIKYSHLLLPIKILCECWLCSEFCNKLLVVILVVNTEKNVEECWSVRTPL